MRRRCAGRAAARFPHPCSSRSHNCVADETASHGGGLVDSARPEPRIPVRSGRRPGKDAEMDVKVIASRYTDRPKTDPAKRVFRIADHIGGSEQSRGSRMYVGDDYRAVVITIAPGDAQEVHMHPATDHAWFIVSGTGE